MAASRILIAVFGLLGLVAAPFVRAQPAPATFESASGVRWTRHVFEDSKGTIGTYYLSTAPDAASLILLIQGSGCVPLFAEVGAQSRIATASQDVLVRVAGERARIMVVEKPGVAFNGQIGPSPGRSEGCGLEFRQRYALDDWAGVLRAALADAATDGRTVAILGVSEGGTAAARLSGTGFAGPIGIISGGACFASGALLDLAYRREREGLPGTSVDDTYRLLGEIAASPTEIDLFAWGQTYLRWSTFGAACNTRVLDHHPGPVFIAYGTGDAGANVAAFEDLAEVRRGESRPVQVFRVRGGDHDLSVGETDHRTETFAAFLAVALGEGR